MKALCCILNYNCNDNADFLYRKFNQYCTACVLDSDSTDPYPYFENLTNLFYTNLFNHAIDKFKSGDYSNLIIITSDIIMDETAIKYTADFANQDMQDVGVWQLQTDIESRNYYNPYIENSKKTYETRYIEGFFQVIHKAVAVEHRKIPLETNKYGVGIDKYTCRIAKQLNKKCIIDTTYLIHHPIEKGYNWVSAHGYDRMFYDWQRSQIDGL